VFLNTAGIKVMQVQVWDKDVTTSDLVGEGQFDLTPIMFGNGQPRNGKNITNIETVQLFHKGKSAGEVYLSIAVRGIGGNQGGRGW
jgi:hypothetical protein